MSARVQIAHAEQTPASTAAVKRLHDLGRGVLVVYPTPGRGGAGIARDMLQALGKRFRDRTPRDPRKLETLAGIWLRAERWVEGLLIAAAERRPAEDWRLLDRLCGETGLRLTMIVEQPASDRHVAALGGDLRELTLAELVAETPVMPEDPWGLFDRSETPDDRPGYPPVPDVDFALFPSACKDVLLHDDAAWAVRTFDQARRATTLWLELRRGIEKRHGPSPRHAHAFLDTLVAPCVTVDGAITSLRGAQAGFLLDGILLEIDADAFAVDHTRHAGAPATSATARMMRSYPEPHLAAAGALACATRANPAQIAGLTLAAVTRVDASLASGHRIALAFQPLLDAQRLARDADGDEPLFLAADGTQPATARHIQRWLARISRETGLRFDTTSGWNRYTTPAWATFHPLAIPALIAR
ncbi:MAG: hypothetical protein ACLP0J_22720 [Solirubrobacteraceae bacterium]|jgi:hypothetical protein